MDMGISGKTALVTGQRVALVWRRLPPSLQKASTSLFAIWT